VSRYGLGYIILKTNNNQKVQGEGVRWRRIFVPFIRKDDLEAGAETDFILRVLMEEILVELSTIISPNLDGV
jgi:hypothetical protein